MMNELELGAHALHRLRMAEKKIATRAERPDELVHDFLLLVRIEIDQDVAAKNDVEVAETVLVFEIMKKNRR